MKKIINKLTSGLHYSIEGLKFLLRDPSWQIELAVVLIASLVVFIIDKTVVEKLILFGVCWLVLIVEALNAGIEATIDRVSLDIHPLAKKAKDVASAAVFLAIINAVIVWLVIFNC